MQKSETQSSSNSTSGKTYDKQAVLSAIQKQYSLSEKQIQDASFDIQGGQFNGITIRNPNE